MTQFQGGLRALYQKCPHLGCKVGDCTTAGASSGFRCPCHGSMYNVIGEYLDGPGAARHGPLPDLDRERARHGRHVVGRRGTGARGPHGPDRASDVVRERWMTETLRDDPALVRRSPTLEVGRHVHAPAAGGRLPPLQGRGVLPPSGRGALARRRPDLLRASSCGRSTARRATARTARVWTRPRSTPRSSSRGPPTSRSRASCAAAFRARRCRPGGTSTGGRSPTSRSPRWSRTSAPGRRRRRAAPIGERRPAPVQEPEVIHRTAVVAALAGMLLAACSSAGPEGASGTVVYIPGYEPGGGGTAADRPAGIHVDRSTDRRRSRRDRPHPHVHRPVQGLTRRRARSRSS